MQQRNLSASMRPMRFSEVIGQKKLKQDLTALFAKRVPMVLMLVGPPGVGKTTLARIIALSVQEKDGTFGEPSAQLLADQSLYNIDIYEKNAADANKVEDMRALMPQFSIYPAFGQYKVFILDEAQKVTDAAQNLLLKPLEDNLSTNLFIIGTSDPGKIISAVKRRAQIFRVPTLEQDEIAQLVARCWTELRSDPISQHAITELTEALWKNDIKAGGLVVQAAERFFSGSSLEDSVILQQAGTIDVTALCSWVLHGNWDEARMILQKATTADVDHIRASLAYRLSNVLLQRPLGDGADRLAEYIYELSSQSAFEDGVLLRATIASIYKICRATQKIAQAA